MMVGKSFKIGDLVWNKHPGYYNTWPGRIEKPPKDLQPQSNKGHHFMRFFGTNEAMWVKSKTIVLHSEEMLQILPKRKSAAWKKAIEEMVNLSHTDSKKASPESGQNNGDKMEWEEMETSATSLNVDEVQGQEQESIANVVVVVPNDNPLSVINEDNFLDQKDTCRTDDCLSQIPKEQMDCVSRPVVDPSESLSDGNIEPAEDSTTLEHIDNLVSVEHPDVPKCSSAPSSPGKAVDNSESQSDVVMISVDTADSSQNLSVPAVCNMEQPSTLTISAALEDQNDNAYIKIGFLGLGKMGSAIVKNLLLAGYNVTVWNRSAGQSDSLVIAGAHRGASPSDVVSKCDIIFSCVSDPEASKFLVFGPEGVLRGFEGSEVGSKGYVELSSNDPSTSEEIGKAISEAGGLYLEAPVSLSKDPEKDKLIVIAAGSRELFKKCHLYFAAMSQNTYFISCEVGSASKLNTVIGMLHGELYGLLAESLKLAEKSNLSLSTFLSFLDQGADLTDYFMERGKAMLDQNSSVTTSLKHQHKLISMALGLCEGNKLPIANAAEKVFNRAQQQKHSDKDVSAVFMSI